MGRDDRQQTLRMGARLARACLLAGTMLALLGAASAAAAENDQSERGPAALPALAQPTITTTVRNEANATITSIPYGRPVHAYAQVRGQSGTPTGTVFVRYFANGTCSDQPADISAALALDASGNRNATSFSKVPNPGARAFQVRFNGDARYAARTGPCTAFTVTKAGPLFVLQLHDASHAFVPMNVPVKTTVHVSLQAASGSAGVTPTGQGGVTWYFATDCGPGSVHSVVYSFAGGLADPAGPAQVANAPLRASFRFSYAGDSRYNAYTSTCHNVDWRLTATMSLAIHNGAHGPVTSVPAGTTIHPRVQVGGSVGPAVGTVSVRWYANGTCSGQQAASKSFALDATSAGVVDGTAFARQPLDPGAYSFRATYLGSFPYLPILAGPCRAVTVTKASPTVKLELHDPTHAAVAQVALNTAIHPWAAVSGPAAAPFGHVTWRYYSGSGCASTTQLGTWSTQLGVIGTAHSSTTYARTIPVTVYWQGHYSGSARYTTARSACVPVSWKALARVSLTIHDASHRSRSSVPVGSTVHPLVGVGGSNGIPGGFVRLRFFTNGVCAGAHTAELDRVLLVDGRADVTALTRTLAAAGLFSYQVRYNGSSTYLPAFACRSITATVASSLDLVPTIGFLLLPLGGGRRRVVSAPARR